VAGKREEMILASSDRSSSVVSRSRHGGIEVAQAHVQQPACNQLEGQYRGHRGSINGASGEIEARCTRCQQFRTEGGKAWVSEGKAWVMKV
jgi:hypothetical protein